VQTGCDGVRKSLQLGCSNRAKLLCFTPSGDGGFLTNGVQTNCGGVQENRSKMGSSTQAKLLCFTLFGERGFLTNGVQTGCGGVQENRSNWGAAIALSCCASPL